MISKEKLKSLLFMAQASMFFASSPEDALYVEEQIEKLNKGEEIG